MKRLLGLDFLRGIGIIGVVFLHSSLYHYGNLLKIDYNNPPAIVILIGMLLMWAGLFAIISGTVNTLQFFRRFKNESKSIKEVLRINTITGLIILLSSYFYFWIVGPAILDRVNGNHDYSVLMNLMIRGKLIFPSLQRIFYVDALTMLGLNIIIIGIIMFFLLRKKDNKKRNYIVVLSLATLFIALSYIRIPLYPVIEEAIKNRNLSILIPLDYLINKNNPILPYLGFGLFGSFIAMLIAYKEKWAIIWKSILGIGLTFLVVGIIGYVTLPDTMLERAIDPMWFYIIVAQVGLFMLMILGALKYFDFRKNEIKTESCKIIRRFGEVSLTIFMLETPISEIFAKILTVVNSDWNQSMAGSLIFGGFMVMFWGFLIYIWEKKEFRYTLEWFIVRISKSFGKESTKLNFLRTS
jgi:peptidoglycan/LPS O-acetylase OafA/YrhL